MAENSAAEPEQQSGGEIDDGDSLLPRWKWVVIGLIALGQAMRTILFEGLASGLGGFIGGALVLVIVFMLVTVLYQRLEFLQLKMIPKRVFIGIALLSGVGSLLSGMLSSTYPPGVFLFFFTTLGVLALAGFGIKSILTSDESPA
ncbi:hypothetical protein ELS19_19915 [Halogeometricum borinquense]|uniref:Uncharacterized protein n=1 Tax=Halogeometricum borinquense TaxID=60847 RepID=A0A482SZ88_9EURY|nr:hypothetical protein [Halogeometricum borinquense]RYJ07756.1 hypothetical protein ELS19_19915 [Halogeometricum borinquense]